MKWSFRLCSIGETQVRVHVTFFLLLIWVGFSFFATQGPVAGLVSVLFILLLFTCVVLHELGHATAARSYGIRTPDITLLPIGGVARLERMPRKPSQEFVIAIAGPLVNVFIASALFLILRKIPDSLFAWNIGDPGALLMNLLKVNLMLILFNLVPAFPMDGGRMFRALLAAVIGYARATRIAASTGQLLALVGGLVGIMLPNPFLILIAIFIFMGAGQEAAMVKLQDATEGLPVTSAMITDFRTLRTDSSLQDAVNALLAGSQHDFPILDEDGSLRGILARKDLITALAEHGRSHSVGNILHESPPGVSVKSSLNRALEVLNASPCPTIPVMQADGKTLAGLLTAENVGEMIMIQTALSERGSLPASKRKTEEPAVV